MVCMVHACCYAGATPVSPWALLQVDLPGLPSPRTRVALLTEAPLSTPVPLSVLYRLSFPMGSGTSGTGSPAMRALSALSEGRAALVLHDLRRGLVGGLRIPRPPGLDPAVQGDVLPVLALAHEHAPNVNALELVGACVGAKESPTPEACEALPTGACSRPQVPRLALAPPAHKGEHP
jgi:hypothetical protein